MIATGAWRLALAAFISLASAAGQAPAGEECAGCHDQVKKIKAAAHADVGCATCHEKHEKYPHPAGTAKPACAVCHAEVAGKHDRSVHGLAAKKGEAAPDCSICHGNSHELKRVIEPEFRKAVPASCGMCHAAEAQKFEGSVHGTALASGTPSAPICTDCHSAHYILPHTNLSSPVAVGHVRETCGHCHGDLRLSSRLNLPADRLTTFDESFHGLAAKAGSQTVANCASCHGYHDILPSSDKRSAVHPLNLPKTCGKCHEGAGSRFAIGTIHWSEGSREPEGVRWVRTVYQVVIPLIVGLMVLHNFGDYWRKLWRLRLRPRVVLTAAAPEAPAAPPAPQIRMYLFERWQHALMAVSFFALVWTGFALKYPGEWWARPLLAAEATVSVRGWIHRIAAVIFIIVSGAHFVSLMVSRRLRQHWHNMFPRRSDIPEALKNFAWHLGWLRTKPKLSAHSYIEKAEYWAVMWGGVVMVATGVILWANDWALAYLPKTFLDIATSIHFYEAVLATVSIFVWHFYFVIFDPEVYPMDSAWLTGFSPRKREPDHEEPARDKE